MWETSSAELSLGVDIQTERGERGERGSEATALSISLSSFLLPLMTLSAPSPSPLAKKMRGTVKEEGRKHVSQSELGGHARGRRKTLPPFFFH
jgi:hypothetical protein